MPVSPPPVIGATDVVTGGGVVFTGAAAGIPVFDPSGEVSIELVTGGGITGAGAAGGAAGAAVAPPFGEPLPELVPPGAGTAGPL
jgi:hypothetical protein